MFNGKLSAALIFFVFVPFHISLAGTFLLWILIFNFPFLFFVIWVAVYLVMEIIGWDGVDLTET